MKALGNLPPGSEAETLQLRAENAELRRQLAIRKKMLKIVNGRLMRMPARKRPRFTAYERYELLEISRHGRQRVWLPARSLHSLTVADPSKSIISFADCRAATTRRFAVGRADWYPHFGKKRIAGLLARMGFHLAVSTIGRIRDEPPLVPTMWPAVRIRGRCQKAAVSLLLPRPECSRSVLTSPDGLCDVLERTDFDGNYECSGRHHSP